MKGGVPILVQSAPAVHRWVVSEILPNHLKLQGLQARDVLRNGAGSALAEAPMDEGPPAEEPFV